MLVNQKTKETKTFDLKADLQYFFDFIKWVNLQSNPIVIFNRSASLPYQENLFLAMINFLNQSPNILMMIQEEKSITSSRYDWKSLINSGVIKALNSDGNKINNFIPLIDKNKINVLFDKSEDGKDISIIQGDHYKFILDELTKLNSQQKLNIVLPDVSFIEFLKNLNLNLMIH